LTDGGVVKKIDKKGKLVVQVWVIWFILNWFLNSSYFPWRNFSVVSVKRPQIMSRCFLKVLIVGAAKLWYC
jgi:hypothetical protein